MYDEKLGFDPGHIATVLDLLAVEIRECGEPLVFLDPGFFEILSPEAPWLRKGFADKLVSAQEEMRLMYPSWRLLIHYAHRNGEKQRREFEDAQSRLRVDNPTWTPEEVLAEATRQWAHPDVAGHPTGGSVDISIWDDVIGAEIAMPTAYDDFTIPAASYRRFPGATFKQKAHALYLELLLVKRDIYPYPGEWWHFDYGNREWAWGRHKLHAIYGLITPPTQ